MNLRGAAKGLDQALYYILLGILVLNALMYLFVFILNWEAYFFGIKFDGPDAGILLFAYFFIPAVLAYLLFRYPRRIVIIALLSIFFFGFHFIDSATTIQAVSGGANSFSEFLAAMVVIPLVVLIGHIIVSQFYDREESDEPKEDEKKTGSATTKPEGEKTGDYPAGQIVILAIVAFAIVFLFGPLLFSIVFSTVFSGLHSVAPPQSPVMTGNSLVTKVDANGTTEWQTVISGYSDFMQEVCPSNDGGYIMAGMFLSGEKSRALRAMKFDSSGNAVWDISRSGSDYNEGDLLDIRRIISTPGEYTAIMQNGIVIRLDEDGNELWHRYYPREKRTVDAISSPSGGYILAGEVNEDGADGWKMFDGWILCADSGGETVWEIKAKEFTYCREVEISPEGFILVNCHAGCYDPDVECSDPEQSGYMIVALDLQGNYLWKTRFVDNVDGEVYSVEPLDNGTIEVYLRGEGERKYILDNEGNVLEKIFLPSRADSYDHDLTLYRNVEEENLNGNGTRIKVTETDGSESVFVIGYAENVTGISRFFSVNPTPDGGYLVAGSVVI